MPELTVRLQALDGPWEVAGADRGAGIVPESVQLTANTWGPDTCRFTIRRDPGGIFPDLREFTPCDVEIAGVLVWSGFVWETPTQEGGDAQIGVEGRGWQYHLDDDQYERTYVHSRLGDWRDVRSYITAPLANYFANGQVEAGGEAVTFGVPNARSWPHLGMVGVVLDLGPDGPWARRVVLTARRGPGAPAIRFGATVADSISAATAAVLDANVGGGMSQSGTVYGFTLGAPSARYVHLWLQNVSGVAYTTGADDLITLTDVKVFTDPAWESGGASILKASDVVRDAVTFAPLLSQDTSLIQSTSLSLTDFGASEDRSPREVWDAVDTYHNWLKKVRADRRCEYRPQPSVPLLRVGNWGGIEFRDAARGSGDPIKNRAVLRGTGPDSSPVKVSRRSGDAAEVIGTSIGAPTFPNPSFAVDASGWAAQFNSVVRDAVTYDSLPAGGRIDPSQEYFWTKLTGTFLRGVTYRVRFRYRTSGAAGYGGLIYLGDDAGAALGTLQTPSKSNRGQVNGYDYDASWRTASITWTPTANSANGRLAILTPANVIGAELMYFDTFTCEIVKPTIVDRRGFTRTHTISMSPGVTPAIGEAIADTYLYSHKRAPFKGDFRAVGPAVRMYLGDAAVHPAHLLLYTAELVHISHHIDPDTGAIGRDAPIVNVAYDHGERQSSVSLDAERDNFEALVARYGMAAGG